MMKINAIISQASDGHYGIYCKNVSCCFADGETESEAREMLEEVLIEQSEYYKSQHGCLPDWAQDGWEIEYRYDFSGFFLSFPFINASGFAKALGINPSLMRKYKKGHAFASEKQKALIQSRFQEIVARMNSVMF